MTTNPDDLDLTAADLRECRLAALRMAQDGFVRHWGGPRGAEVFREVCPGLARELQGLEAALEAEQMLTGPSLESTLRSNCADRVAQALDAQIMQQLSPAEPGVGRTYEHLHEGLGVDCKLCGAPHYPYGCRVYRKADGTWTNIPK